MGKDCSLCGAYIADGLDSCPACGKRVKEDNDHNAASSNAVNGNYAYSYAVEKDNNRKEASGESPHKAWQEEAEEFRRRALKEQERLKRESSGNPGGENEEEMRRRIEAEVRREYLNREAIKNRAAFRNGYDKRTRLLGALSYFGALGIIPFILGIKEKEHYLRFHSIQGLLLTLVDIIVSQFTEHSLLGFIWGVIHFVAAIIGIKAALRGEKQKLPYLGKIAAENDDVEDEADE